MHVCIYVCIYTYIHTYIHIYIYERERERENNSECARKRRQTRCPTLMLRHGERAARAVVCRTGRRQSLSPSNATAWCWRAAPNREAGAGAKNADACCYGACVHARTCVFVCVCVCVCARVDRGSLRARRRRRNGRVHADEGALVRLRISAPCVRASGGQRRTGACQRRRRRRPASLEQRRAQAPHIN